MSLQDLELEAGQDLVIFILEGNRNTERAHRCYRVEILGAVEPLTFGLLLCDRKCRAC